MQSAETQGKELDEFELKLFDGDKMVIWDSIQSGNMECLPASANNFAASLTALFYWFK